MKGVFSLLIFAAVCSCVQSKLPMHGNCTFEQNLVNSKKCQVSFVHDLQKNPKTDCSTELDKYLDCAAKSMMVCYPHFKEAMLKEMLKKSFTKEIMCDKLGMHFPRPEDINGTFPCSITREEYDKKVDSCTEQILKMWKANRADTGTCGEFKKTKECIMKIAKDAKCTLSEDDKEREKLMLDNHNPFCSNGVDTNGGSGGGGKKPNDALTLNGPSAFLALVLFIFFVISKYFF